MYQRIEENIKGSVDWFTIGLYFVLIIFGWLSVYAASYDLENATSIFDLSSRAGKQLVWMGIALILGFTLLKIESSTFDLLAYFIYAGAIFLLFITIFIAPDIKGSRSWLVVASDIRVQPAEFAKFAAALAIAKYMSSYNFKLMTVKNLFATVAIILLPMGLIFLQKETGSALVYLAFVFVLYRQGLPGIVLYSGFLAIVFFIVELKYSDIPMGVVSMAEIISFTLIIITTIFLVATNKKGRADGDARYMVIGLVSILGLCGLLSLLGINPNWGYVIILLLTVTIAYLFFLSWKHWTKTYLIIALYAICCIGFIYSIDFVFDNVVQPHQQTRIKVALGMEEDPMGAEYNVIQSKIAIGSGGFLGKGYLNGTQTKLKYVPEQDTDFIFCTIGEETGFIGSVTILLLFSTLILRLIYLAERQKEIFGQIFGYCVASVLLFHLIINIGMVIGLTPVIGIPLPFFSYGGSSLLGFTILLFIFLRLDMTRKRR